MHVYHARPDTMKKRKKGTTDMPWSLRMITYAGILLLILLIYFGYRYFRSVKMLNLSPAWLFRLLFFIPAILFIVYPVAGNLHYWTRGSFSHTGYPGLVIYLYWYGVVCMGVMVNWLLLHDLLRPLVSRFSGIDPQKLKSLFAGIFLVTAGMTVIYTAVKMSRDTGRIVLDEISYTLAGGNRPVEPLTIVHISDLHADQYTGEQKIRRYIKKVNEANPDIVVFTGDLISSGIDHIHAGADALASIESTHGVWFVMGDHDYWVGTDLIAEALEERGIHVLQNENAVIMHNELIVKLTGITELYSARVDAWLLEDLLDEEAGEGLHLIASHQASDRLIRETRNSGAHLLLAGHTHGGQIRVPLFFYAITPARAESYYVKGNWQLGEMLLNINNGLGFTLAPVRYKAPAQVSVFRVQ
jgi:uncharacterized protein